ncbi:MAG: response regulator [Candidatus Electrothrix sp. YB6]
MKETEHSAPKQRISVGLGRTLFLTFLLLALGPLSVVSYISYQNATESLRRKTMDSLVAAMAYKKDFIERYFTEIKADIEIQAELSGNVSMLKKLITAFDRSGLSVKEFVTSIDWELINTEDGNALRAYQHAYQYRDIYLVDINQNILYSASERNVGENIQSEEYESCRLGQAYRDAVGTGRAVLSDYGYYEAGKESDTDNTTLSLFLAKAVEDDETGRKIGALIFEIPYTQLDPFMRTNFGLGKSGETYLVGADLLIRSTLRFIEDSKILGTRVDTELVRKWQQEHAQWHQLQEQAPDVSLPAPYSTEEMIYADYRGVSVLGMYSSLDFVGQLGQWGIHWVLVAEVDEEEAFASTTTLKYVVVALLLATAVVVLLLSWLITARLVAPVRSLTLWARQVAEGDLSMLDISAPANEIGELNRSFQETVRSLRKAEEENERYTWLQTGQLELDDQLRGNPPLNELCKKLLTYLAGYLGAQVGTLYVNEQDVLCLQASYAYKVRKHLADRFCIGEGMVGQAALEQQTIILTQVPDDYIRVTSGLGEKPPNTLLLVPFVYNDTVQAVLELGSFLPFTEQEMAFLEGISSKLAVAINGALARKKLQETLAVTTEQANVLQSQQEELKAANQELEEQTQRLRASEEELQANQDQLMATNEQLAEKNRSLRRRKEEIEQTNKELQLSRKELERKAEEVARASQYKSEFLANMSHELRTPLNSLLLLARTLEENKAGNLTEDDIESVGVIRNSGNELLVLINDILDLSKIEAGQMVLVRERVYFADVLKDLEAMFRHLAEEKGLELRFVLAENTPEYIDSDRNRLEQILKNLLSNALKFTEHGTVAVSVSPVVSAASQAADIIDTVDTISLAVQDTGVGIPPDKQEIIFEAFQQASGGTARKYGGTGLGLSISRKLVKLLGGEIRLQSREGEGTTFTVYLPVSSSSSAFSPARGNRPDTQENGDAPQQPVQSVFDVAPAAETNTTSLEDDRHDLQENDRIVLVIEDDSRFAALLVRQCREKGLKALTAASGEEGLRLAESYQPTAVILDLKLPGMSGWEVLAALKAQIETRHIPVHIISADEVGALDARRRGAVEALQKPVNKEQLEAALCNIEETAQQNIRALLVADRNAEQRKTVIRLIGNGDVQSTEAGSGREILDSLQTGHYDCLIMGLDFPDMSGLSLLQQLKADRKESLPIIIYTARELSRAENAELRQYAGSVIIKGVMSEERLLDESAFFLHRMISGLPERQQRMIRNLHEDDAVFQGKRILLVDDDMRNIFALAKVLQEKGMGTVKAEDGARALAVLEEDDEFDLVLMDIMMPVMDGYETIRKIREQPRWKTLPIIALTAKAMKDDRSRCITAGANDYLAKPVDTERLLALLRLWLYS